MTAKVNFDHERSGRDICMPTKFLCFFVLFAVKKTLALKNKARLIFRQPRFFSAAACIHAGKGYI